MCYHYINSKILSLPIQTHTYMNTRIQHHLHHYNLVPFTSHTHNHTHIHIHTHTHTHANTNTTPLPPEGPVLRPTGRRVPRHAPRRLSQVPRRRIAERARPVMREAASPPGGSAGYRGRPIAARRDRDLSGGGTRAL